jgi:diguanylate cyclase (GGDEF)-like protein
MASYQTREDLLTDNRISILCIDENKTFAKTAEGILKKDLRGASFTFIQNSDSALHHLSEHSVDLVLLGHHSPKLDGLQVMEDLRRKKIDTAIIMIPSHGNERTAVEAMKRGAYDYISKKELNATTLKSAVKNAITQKRMEERSRQAKERIKVQATQDGLTQLYNHRHFQHLLDKEYRQARRYDYPLYCFMLDLDDFKSINDNYGHVFGDFVLKKSAEILRKQMRDIDILARYGGEEFAVVCTHIKEEGVLALCERVRDSFARYIFKNGKKSARVTISIGLASNSDHRVSSPSVLIRHADEALYEAKHRGKNNVCHWREKQTMSRLLDKDSQQKIEYYQNRFLGFTHEIIDKFLEYSRSIVEDIEKKDRRTAQHSSKVTRYSVALARALKFPESEINTIQLAGMLHDIGKAGIDPKIIYKKGEYKPKEFRIMKLHPLFSVKMIEPLNFLDQEMQVILQHHERFDGRGYPTGRKGLDISRGARVLNLCDSYDAMTAGRCYKKKISPKQACRAIGEAAGNQFDTEIAKVFIQVVEKNAL